MRVLGVVRALRVGPLHLPPIRLGLLGSQAPALLLGVDLAGGLRELCKVGLHIGRSPLERGPSLCPDEGKVGRGHLRAWLSPARGSALLALPRRTRGLALGNSRGGGVVGGGAAGARWEDGGGGGFGGGRLRLLGKAPLLLAFEELLPDLRVGVRVLGLWPARRGVVIQ